ncbi:hypothetical protein LTR42_002432 [Elasticomyces elasticus]|nr:hypothetical protein LTR42_002432 [Elasticomyces elasticus]
MSTENTTPTSTVKTFLAAIKHHDTDRMRDICHPDATGCLIRDGRPVYTTVAAILQRLDERKDEAMEEISWDEVEHVCGDFASVWAPYKFFSGGKFGGYGCLIVLDTTESPNLHVAMMDLLNPSDTVHINQKDNVPL